MAHVSEKRHLRLRRLTLHAPPCHYHQVESGKRHDDKHKYYGAQDEVNFLVTVLREEEVHTSVKLLKLTADVAHFLRLHQHCFRIVLRYECGFHVVVALIRPAFKYVEGQLHNDVAARRVYVRRVEHAVEHQPDASVLAGKRVDANKTYAFIQSVTLRRLPCAERHAVVLRENIIRHNAFRQYLVQRFGSALLQPGAVFYGHKVYVWVVLDGLNETSVTLDCRRRAFKSAYFGHRTLASEARGDVLSDGMSYLFVVRSDERRVLARACLAVEKDNRYALVVGPVNSGSYRIDLVGRHY